MASIRVRIVVADRVGSEPPRCLYVGTDAAKADAAFDEATKDEKNEWVGSWVYPNPARQSFPAENQRATLVAQERKKAEAEKAAKDAKEKADQLEADAKSAKEAAIKAKAAADKHTTPNPSKQTK